MEELKKRKTPRYQEYDYNNDGIYFITICTKDRECILSQITKAEDNDRIELKLTDCGEIANKYIRNLNEFYDHLSIEKYVIMPNHIHLLLWIKNAESPNEYGQSGTPVPTNVLRANNACSRFVSTFKRFCNKEYGENIWQSRFNDHIIRNHDDYEEHVEYICKNPINWYYDELYAEE